MNQFMNLKGLPYLFGISLFMFEGNALALEIHHQTDNPEKVFMPAVLSAISLTCGLIVVVGCLSYAAYGQYTQSIILLNLKGGTFTSVVQVFYSVGILCSYCL